MATQYRIHPGIGIARLGNSPDGLCITPEEPAALPIDCDAQGNPLLSPDGRSELRVKAFKDARGRIKRQAARFQIWVYDDDSPEGRPLRLGDPIAGGGNDGVLVDIQWRVYLANKKASWYEFRQLEGEHGDEQQARRNADITDPEARQRLIIDPGPRIVDCQTRRSARFDRDCDIYAPTFPPPLQPKSIDTLGEILTDNSGRLLVLGGHGNSGTFKFDQFGQPRIDTYANNDGWFDDTSDGPVMARLVMYSKAVGQVRFIDVEYPAWVIVGYPAYVPQILDMVTAEEVIEEMAIRLFAERTDLYGEVGTFNDPQVIDRRDPEALVLWRAGRLEWNPGYRPWFYRDIWPILFRPDEFTYTSNVLGQSNYPHNQSARGRFDPNKLSVPPMIDHKALAACEKRCIRRNHSGELFVDTFGPALTVLEKQTEARLSRVAEGAGGAVSGMLTGDVTKALLEALSTFAHAVHGDKPVEDFGEYLKRWRAAAGSSPDYVKAKDALERRIEKILCGLPEQRAARFDVQAGQIAARAEDPRHPVQPADMAAGGVEKVFDNLGAQLRVAMLEHLRKYHTGKLLEDCRRKCVEANTYDLYREYRTFLFNLLRQSGEENQFGAGGRANSRTYNLPLMPLLAGDNPISNKLPSKFLRLTEYQYFLLRQWARGLFYNEELEGWSKPDPWQPYAGWVNRTGRDLDRGVLTNVLGGAFCPGGEVGWVLRNPSIYREPYRIKADPEFFEFRQTAAQANALRGRVPEADYASYVSNDLSQDNNFDVGLQPGDLTKYMALPWQADFNECTTQPIDITYDEWNVIDPDSDHDSRMKREQRAWETLWWPAHRPLQTYEVTGFANGAPAYRWVDWSRGVPGTNAGDLKMVTEWWRLGFVVQNPYLPLPVLPTELPPDQKYISVERTEGAREEEEV